MMFRTLNGSYWVGHSEIEIPRVTKEALPNVKSLSDPCWNHIWCHFWIQHNRWTHICPQKGEAYWGSSQRAFRWKFFSNIEYHYRMQFPIQCRVKASTRVSKRGSPEVGCTTVEYRHCSPTDLGWFSLEYRTRRRVFRGPLNYGWLQEGNDPYFQRTMKGLTLGFLLRMEKSTLYPKEKFKNPCWQILRKQTWEFSIHHKSQEPNPLRQLILPKSVFASWLSQIARSADGLHGIDVQRWIWTATL